MNREKGTNDKYVCPCCGFATLDGVDQYEICKICFWEDDGQDDPQENESWGGPNNISLADARINFIKNGVSDNKDLPHVRKPTKSDQNIRNYTIVNGKAVANKNT